MMPSKNQSLTGSNANENKFITQKKMNRREALRRAIDAKMEKVASDKIDWKESQMLQAAIAASAAEDKKKVEMFATETPALSSSSPIKIPARLPLANAGRRVVSAAASAACQPGLGPPGFGGT